MVKTQKCAKAFYANSLYLYNGRQKRTSYKEKQREFKDPESLKLLN